MRFFIRDGQPNIFVILVLIAIASFVGFAAIN